MEISQAGGRTNRKETRLRRGWRFTWASWRLAWRDRTVLFLGLIAGLCGIATLGATFVLVTGHLGINRGGDSKLAAAALLVSYPLTFLLVFLHVAIAAAAGARLEGRHLSLGRALRTAHRRTLGISLWALMVFGFGFLLRLAGALLPPGLGLAIWPLDLLWALATIFVVPLLAFEDAGVHEALHNSWKLLRRGWGEGLTGIVVIGVLTVLMVLPAFFLFLAGLATIVLASSGGLILIVAGLAVVVAARSLTGALQQVFAVELYRYANDHVEVTVC